MILYFLVIFILLGIVIIKRKNSKSDSKYEKRINCSGSAKKSELYNMICDYISLRTSNNCT